MKKVKLLVLSLIFLLLCINFYSNKEVTIAFGSCVKGDDSKVWKNISSKNPDILILLGDSIYLKEKHFGKKKKIIKKYKSIYKNKAFKKLKKRTRVYAIWDDHDYGYNNADSTFKYKKASLKAFRDYWKNNLDPPTALENSIAFNVVLKDVEFIFTDNRSFRVAPTKKNQGVLFGKAQLAWIKDRFIKTKASTIVLASGGMLFSKSKDKESLHHFPKEKMVLENMIKQLKKDLIIISGDSHFANVGKFKLGKKEFYEFTSSPLNAHVTEDLRLPMDSNREIYDNTETNFGLLTLVNKSLFSKFLSQNSNFSVFSSKKNKEIFRFELN